METMKAVICTKYGPPEVLKIIDAEKPKPKDNEILIKVFATTVHIGDTKIRAFKPGLGFFKDLIFKPIMHIVMGFTGPRKNILGMELSGVIEETGKNVDLFKKGDEVFASTEMHFGAYAEYARLPQNGAIALKPENITHEEAAALSNGGATALSQLRKANIKKGDKVLVYGASGSLGTFAVQIAKSFGAEVTGVCSAGNLEMVRSLGIDKVLDYTAPDFIKNLGSYDVIYDAVGKMKSSDIKKCLKKTGVYRNVLSLSFDSIRIKVADLITLKELAEAGKLKSVIDRKYTLDEIVEAHRYVEKGHKKGNVAVTVNTSK